MKRKSLAVIGFTFFLVLFFSDSLTNIQTMSVIGKAKIGMVTMGSPTELP